MNFKSLVSLDELLALVAVPLIVLIQGLGDLELVEAVFELYV